MMRNPSERSDFLGWPRRELYTFVNHFLLICFQIEERKFIVYKRAEKNLFKAFTLVC